MIITVPIELDKPRNMAFTLGAMKALQSRNIDLAKLQGLDLETLSFLIYQLLRHEDKSLTQERVDDMVDLQNLPELTEKMTELMTACNTATQEYARKAAIAAAGKENPTLAPVN